jgi:hypothetical protein
MDEKYCQSCGMPLTDAAMFGTEKDGSKSEEYCSYCYTDGAFVQPDMTMQAMKDLCLPFVKEGGMDEAAASALLDQTLPQLKRWKK